MNPNVFKNDSDLANILLRSCPKEDFFLISIDGLNQAGKSTLAKNLVKLMDTEYIEVDHYLEKHKGGYIDYIRYNDLREAINRIRQKSRVLIIDGICILEILNRIGIKPDITIYVKFVSPHGIWYDESMFSPPGIAAKEEINEMPGGTRDLIRYHGKYRPHEKADFVFEQVKKDS